MELFEYNNFDFSRKMTISVYTSTVVHMYTYITSLPIQLGTGEKCSSIYLLNSYMLIF